MDLIFCKLQKAWIESFCKRKKTQKHGFNFLLAQKAKKTRISFCVCVCLCLFVFGKLKQLKTKKWF